METGRHPTLPMHTFFPFLRKKEEKEEDYVSDIVGKLDRAFEKARQLQYDAAVKNEQIKGINRYEPDFKPDDWLGVEASSRRKPMGSRGRRRSWQDSYEVAKSVDRTIPHGSMDDKPKLCIGRE